MAKIQSQTGDITIKKEEEEDRKPILVLHSVRITPRITKRKRSKSNSSHLLAQHVKVEEEDCKPALILHSVRITPRITKRKRSKSNRSHLPVQQVKVEENTDTKSLLKPRPKQSRQKISQKQINQLIDAIVNDKMSVTKASRKANISSSAGLNYYNVYKNDPAKRIPSPRNRFVHTEKLYTQQQIGSLINYIDHDKMPVEEASEKANMTCSDAHQCYDNYLNGSDQNIPISCVSPHYTQDKLNEFIGDIIDTGMSIHEASEKANVDYTTGRKYFRRYVKDHNVDMPVPKYVTNDKMDEIVGYIVRDKMSIIAASKKAKVTAKTASKCYHKYLKNNNLNRSTLKHGQDVFNRVAGYIIHDKMSIVAASKRVNIPVSTGGSYYLRYLKDRNLPMPGPKYTQDQKNQLVDYVFTNKMSVMAASRRANMCYESGKRYYHRYLKKNNLKPPARGYTRDRINGLIKGVVNDEMSVKAASRRSKIPYSTGYRYFQRYKKDLPTPKYTQEKINELIGYIVDDKMTVNSASRKANIAYRSAKMHYRQYQKDRNIEVPTRQLDSVLKDGEMACLVL